MKNLSEFISESLNEAEVIGKSDDGMYHPKTTDELKELITVLLRRRGSKADLNDIDTSKITHMDQVFANSKFNGDISKWLCSGASMRHAFDNSPLADNPPAWYKG